MTPARYHQIKCQVFARGFADEIIWAETVGPPEDAAGLWLEYGWVVVNSGMHNRVAAKIWDRICKAIIERRPVSSAFGHPGKAAAIQEAWDNRHARLQEFEEAPDKLAWIAGLPWIGKITKYHLAKNLGLDCCKPDRHLVRIAEHFRTRPEELCGGLAMATGDRIGTVDLVLWRGTVLGLVPEARI